MDAISIPHSTVVLLVRLVLATILGAAVGANREMRSKPAGLRTHALVALGGALFALVGLALTPEATVLDFDAASRLLQGVVAGVGFIGGGVILRRDDAKGVHGLSTAASIWVVAAIGVSSGLGLWRAAVIAVILALGVLALGTPIDRKLRELKREEPPR